MNKNIENCNSEEKEIYLLKLLKNKEYNESIFFKIIEEMDNDSLNYIKKYLFIYLGKKECNKFLIRLIEKEKNRFDINDIFDKLINIDYMLEIIENLFLEEIDKIDIKKIDTTLISCVHSIQTKVKLNNF